MNFLIGLIAGVVGGLVGLGGGVLMIPLMVSWKGIGQHKAHGTSLVAVAFTGIVGAVTYASFNALDIWAAIIVSAAALWPARLGAKYCCEVPELKLKRIFGVFLIFVSFFLLLKPYFPSFSHSHMSLWEILILLITGVATGFVSGIMGVGGGPLMIGGMVLLAGFDQYTAQGSSLLAMVPLAAVGAFTHWRLGNVEENLLKGIIPGIILGRYAGGSCAHFLPENILRFIFAAVLIWTGSRYVKSPVPTCD
ncbi:MAG TPA: sulfite exporter TauE/SafE family protein [Syntrophales bacterium]|nr:sulfite exporter TauE/SafE family protein [Syntrophales bacterium]